MHTGFEKLETSMFDFCLNLKPFVKKGSDRNGKKLKNHEFVKSKKEPPNNVEKVEDVSFLGKSKNKKQKLTDFRLGLWNCNSINQKKLDFAISYLNKTKPAFLALTELTSDNSDIHHWLSKNPDYPILTWHDNRRVGLMIPAYLESKIEVIDGWSTTQKRKRKSQKICQITLYQVKMPSDEFVIAVGYLAPDASQNSKNVTFDKITEIAEKYKKVICVGDFNIDCAKKENVDFIQANIGGIYKQKVKKPTRVATRRINNENHTSKTVIDLVFVSESLSKMYKSYRIERETVSDHFLIESEYTVKLPSVYIEKEVYLDPTRRPRMKPEICKTVNGLLSEKIESDWSEIKNMPQNEIFEYLETNIVLFLDQHNKKNNAEKKIRKIYRRTLPDSILELRRQKYVSLNRLRMLRRKKASDSEIKTALEEFKKLRNKLSKQLSANLRDEKNKAVQTYLQDNSDNMWKVIKRMKIADHIDSSKKAIEITENIRDKNGKIIKKIKHEKKDMANHMAKFFKSRALLVPDEQMKEYSEFVPVVDKKDVLVEFDFNKKYDIKKLYTSRKKPGLACGPDSISLLHIHDLMPSIEKVLDLAINHKPPEKF